MSDVAGAAPAAAEPIAAPVDGAPINEAPANFNAPLGSQIPAEATPAPKAEPKVQSIDDSIDRAIAKSAAKTAEAKPEPKAEAKVEAKPEQPRENGKFVAKDKPPVADSAQPAQPAKAVEAPKPSHTAEDAPSRFTETAKAKWAAADPEIRGETLRMQRELTEGYQKHREKAEKFEALKDFDEIATKSGTTLKDALTRYHGMEQKLRGDLIGGLDEIVANATGGKTSLRDIAAYVMGQTPEQAQSQSDATIRELKQTITQLQQQVGGVVETVNTQRQQSTLAEINKFASDHPRFEELSDDIAFFMKSGRAKDLAEAYDLAERLNPASAPAPAVPAASSAAPAPAPAQPDKGQKSINGAPSSGFTSQPGKKRAAKSLDDALNDAFAAVG